MIKALSLHPWLNTPAETKRLEAARAAMGNWKSYSHACQAPHNAHLRDDGPFDAQPMSLSLARDLLALADQKVS
jgi:hypothetical protein